LHQLVAELDHLRKVVAGIHMQQRKGQRAGKAAIAAAAFEGLVGEVAASFERPALLFSAGKDSCVVHHLALKAF